MPTSQSPSRFAAGVALRLSQPNLDAITPCLNDPALGEAKSGQRILVGFVPDAQLDRVHAKFNRELVHRGFEPERADRFAWCAHESVGDHIHLHRFDVQEKGLRCVDAFRRKDERLWHVVVRSHCHHAGMDQGVEPSIRLRAKRDALFGDGTAADDTEYPLA
jgi:hypothetical protein